MLVLWLATFALTALPQLHTLLHKDAQTLNHNCLVTQLQQHSITSAGTGILIPTPFISGLVASRPDEFPVLVSGDYRLSPSRAPPAFSSSAMVVG